MKQSSVLAPVSHRPHGSGGSVLLSGVLVGFCSSSVGFLTPWSAVWYRLRIAPTIVENASVAQKNADASGTLAQPVRTPPIKKLYTDRINPTLAEISHEKRALGTPKPIIRLKASPAGNRDRCKPGRTRNNQGQCGRWPSKGISRTASGQKEQPVKKEQHRSESR